MRGREGEEGAAPYMRGSGGGVWGGRGWRAGQGGMVAEWRRGSESYSSTWKETRGMRGEAAGGCIATRRMRSCDGGGSKPTTTPREPLTSLLAWSKFLSSMT